MDRTGKGNYLGCKYSVSVAAFWAASGSWWCKESELEDDQTLSADSAMQFQNCLLSERISLRMDKHGQGAFHHEYRC